MDASLRAGRRAHGSRNRRLCFSGIGGLLAAALAAALVPGAVQAAPPGSALPFDFNGDGCTDLAVGVPGEAIGKRALAGAVNVIYGSPRGPATAGNRLWSQASHGITGTAEANDYFGAAFASGDFDRDGYADLAIGVPGEAFTSRHNVGAVHVMYGSAAGLTTARDRIWHQGSPGVPGMNEGNDRFGATLAVGDFDGDGYADLAIAAPGENVGTIYEAGQVTILRGSALGLGTSGAQLWNQGSPGIADDPEDLGENWAGEGFGSALAAGDANGDGRADLAVGVPNEDHARGAAHVLLGSAAGLTATGSQFFNTAAVEPGVLANSERFGGALALADVTGDGRDDLVVGRPGAIVGPTDSGFSGGGKVSVLIAQPGGAFSGSAVQTLYPGAAGLPGPAEQQAYFGTELVAGDFNGDGIADLAVGAPWTKVGTVYSAGAVYLLSGSPAGLVGSSQLLTQSTPGVPDVPETSDWFGITMATGRFNASTQAWLVVGNYKESVGSHKHAGAVTFIPGSPSGLAPAASQFWSQDSPSVQGKSERQDHFGWVSSDAVNLDLWAE